MSCVLSSLLTTRENGLLFHLIGQDCRVSACAVVQLCLATAAHKGQKSEWEVHSCGVVCLVQDRKLNSTFMRLFNVKRATLLWEQELYIPFEYSTPCPYFHTFPSDDCQAGLNFANEQEASRFSSAVQKCISSTKVPRMLVRTLSLDSTSRWLPRDNLSACLNVSSTCRQSPPTLDVEVTNQPFRPGIKKASCSPPTSHSCSSPGTKTTSVSLAQRKGPLPPIPSNANTASFNLNHNADHLTAHLSFPLPPPYPAPKMMANPTGVKKRATFSPENDAPKKPAFYSQHRNREL